MERESIDRSGMWMRVGLTASFFLLVLFGFVVTAVWWIESRFGSNMAAGVLIAFLALVVAGITALVTYKIMSHTQTSSADMIASVSDSFRARANVDAKQAAYDLLQARAADQYVADVQKMAVQRAGLLVDLERKNWELKAIAAAPAPAAEDDPPAWLQAARRSSGGGPAILS